MTTKTARLLAVLGICVSAPVVSATLTSTGDIALFNGTPIDASNINSSTDVRIGSTTNGSIFLNGDPFSGNGIISVFSDSLSVGGPAGIIGDLTLNGFGSSWQANGTQFAETFLGFDGEGTLNVENGAFFSSPRGTFHLGGDTNQFSGVGSGTGEATVTGTSSQLVTNFVVVGAGPSATGRLTVSNGGVLDVTTDTIWLGFHDADGFLTVTGPVSSIINVEEMIVGRAGRGTVEVLDGGTISPDGSSNETSIIGEFSGSLGQVTVSGNGSNWTSANDRLWIGDEGTARLTIASGGLVLFNQVVLGTETTGRGQLTFTIGDNGTGSIESGLLEVGGQLDIGDGFGLFGVEVASDDRLKVTFGDQFTLADYGSYSGDVFLKTDLGVTGFLNDGGTVISSNGVRFVIDFDADLDGQGDLGITATILDFLADTDGDTDVDDTDLGVAISNFNGPGGIGKDIATGDVDGDGDVDDTDLGAAISFFTGPKASSVTAVPEPTAIVLLAMGLSFVARRRRN